MYWSSQKLKEKAKHQALINPFEEAHVKHCAYELTLGKEAFITSAESGTKQVLKSKDQVQIPPGQFGLLITQEVVKVPSDAIAFISIRSKVKFRGLVNVSGFHVDPGFEGRLKFSVYNAGSQPVVIDVGERIFMIWYADLDQATEDPYQGDFQKHNTLTAENINNLQGAIASPGTLKKQFDELKHDYDKRMSMISAELGLWRVVGFLILSWIILLMNRPVQNSQPAVAPSPTFTPQRPVSKNR